MVVVGRKEEVEMKGRAGYPVNEKNRVIKYHRYI